MSEASKIRTRVLRYLLGNGVDIGCGEERIVPFGIGLDRRASARGSTWEGDARDIPLKDGTCGWVFSSHTLEDLQDTEAALREWWRVLAVGGNLVLYLPDRRWYPNIGHPLANKGHRHDFIAEDVLAAMSWATYLLKVQEDRPPPGGVYDYDRRGQIEYSFLLVLEKLA